MKSMKPLLKAFAWSSVIVAVASAQGDRSAGTWKLNTGKSTVASMPKSETMVLQFSGQTERASFESVAADGAARKTEYTATQNDGKWHPMKSSGAPMPAGRGFQSAMVVKLDDDHTVRFTKREDGVPGIHLGAVSKDGKTYTWTSIGIDGKVNGIYVFDKVP